MVPRVVVLGLVLGQLAGCISGGNWPYPPDWPSRQSLGPTQCPDISGLYANRTEVVAGPYSGESLYDLFDNSEGFVHGRCPGCRVSISWLDASQDLLSIALQGADSGAPDGDQGLGLVLSRPKGDFTCADGVLTTKIKRGMTVVLAGSLELGRLDLSLAEDGSLIARQEFTRLGYLTLVPAGGKFVTFARWERRAGNPEGN